jgi:hypothetical protein
MRKRFRGRRPSAPMAISLTALFFAFGGVGYAATQLPSDSVGTRQLRNNSVTWFKIAPGTIGSARINQALVQTRVVGTCSGTNGAIGAITQSGHATCNPSMSKEFGTNSGATPITSSSTTVATLPLNAGTYLLLGDAYASNTGPTDSTLTCVLGVNTGSSVTRSITVPAGGQGALPINVASTAAPNRPPTPVVEGVMSCHQTGSTVSVTGQINAIQTADNS